MTTTRKGNVPVGFGFLFLALLLFALSFVEFGDSTEPGTVTHGDTLIGGTSRITQKTCDELRLPDTDTTCKSARELIDADGAIDHWWLVALAAVAAGLGIAAFMGKVFGPKPPNQQIKPIHALLLFQPTPVFDDTKMGTLEILGWGFLIVIVAAALIWGGVQMIKRLDRSEQDPYA